MSSEVEAVPERAVRLHVNERRVAAWTCTPEGLDALAAGRLLADGFIRRADDLRDIRIRAADHPVIEIEATVAPEPFEEGLAEAVHRATHGCGARFLLDCRPELIHRIDAAAPPAPPESDRLQQRFRDLFEASPGRGASAGHHAAALCDGGRLLRVHEEIGRHNAVDKAIGAAILDDADLPRLGLVISARVSGDIAAKAARARLAWIASRSVPTTLAVEIAAAAGILIVARAAGPDARLFAGGAA